MASESVAARPVDERHARQELIGVVVFFGIGIIFLVLAPAKQALQSTAAAVAHS
jgi:hypothetical protein